MGTDFAGFITEFDKGLPETEIDLMVKAGLSNMEIISAATKNAAFVCDLSTEIGTIEKGKRADMLIVDGNPVQDIKLLSKVKMVLKNGQIVE